MLFKILTTISVLWICVDGTTPEDSHQPNHAVSSQSFHRDDVPLSYKYSSVHIYTTPHPEQRKHYQHDIPNYSVQYAPLHVTKESQQQTTDTTDEYPTERTVKNYLEPRPVQNSGENRQKHISYIPGHNIEVQQSNRVHGHNNLRPYQNNLQNQQNNGDVLTFVIYKKPEQQDHHTAQQITDHHQPLSGNRNIFYTFSPQQYGVDAQYKNYAVANHHLQALGTPQTLSKIPNRLHLNVARVYSLAQMSQQALPNTPRSLAKPPAYTEAIFLPNQIQRKTILYPVQDLHKNYPVVSS